MKKSDIYHRWVAWPEEDQTYIGRCPDLFSGGVHHDTDPIECARKLQDAIDDVSRDFTSDEEWPEVTLKPPAECAA